MFNPEGVDSKREWIEVQNTSNETIDLTTYRFTENDTDHLIRATQKPTLEPNEIAIIADNPETFNLEYKNVPLVFDSSFSLKNEGESLHLKDKDKNIIHTANYHAGENNGYSYHLTKTSNFFATPNPGEVGSKPPQTSIDKEIKTDSQKKEEEEETKKETDNDEPSFPTFYKGDLQTDETIIAGNTHTFIPTVNYHRSDGKIISKNRGEIHINFGDGTIRQMESVAPVKHRYQYPGEYITIFTYQKSHLTENPNLTIKSVITVTENPVTIDRNNRDITITNNHHTYLDISNWQLKNKNSKTFVFPENTQVASNATLTIPYNRFIYRSCREENPIELYSKDNSLMSTYICHKPKQVTISPPVSTAIPTREEPKEETVTESIPLIKGEILPTPPPKKEPTTKALWQLVGVIILISTGMIYLKHQEEATSIEKQLT